MILDIAISPIAIPIEPSFPCLGLRGLGFRAHGYGTALHMVLTQERGYSISTLQLYRARL